MFSSTVEHFVRDIERISILKNNEEKNNEIKSLFVELNKTAFNDADKIALKEALEKHGLIESADITNLISILENENLKSIICVCEEGNKVKSAATQKNIEKKIADYFLNQLNDLKEKLKTVTNEEQKDHVVVDKSETQKTQEAEIETKKQKQDSLYALMYVLWQNARKNNSEQKIVEISDKIKSLLQSYETPTQVLALLNELSEEVTKSDGITTHTVLYWLTDALSLATDKNPQAVSQICNIIRLIFQKSFDVDLLTHCLKKGKPTDDFYDALFDDLLKNIRTDIPLRKLKGLLSEPLKAYLKRMTYKKLTEINASENKNSILVQLIDYRTIPFSSKQSETRKVLEAQIEEKNPRHLFNLMNALCQNASINNSAEIVRISDKIKCLLQSNETPEQTLALLIGLSEKITVGNFAGRNALFDLMNALVWAAQNNLQEAVSSICVVITTLLNQCTKDEQVQQLLSGLSEKLTAGNDSGKNALYLLINALAWAAKKDPQAVFSICGVIATLLNKCTKDEQVQQLLSGLSEKQTAGDFSGSNALYQLIVALPWVAESNPQAASSICGVIATFLKKCTTAEQVKQLLSGLSEKRTAGNFAGRNALFNLMSAFSQEIKINANKNSNAPISNLISKLILKFFNLSVVNDERIFENLAQFLTKLLSIQDCSPRNELLSQVIQLLQKNINVYSTEQREKIHGIFKSCQKEFTWVPVAVTPVVEVKDTPVKPVIPAEPVESQPPSYDELFPGMFENEAFFFWIDNLNQAPVSRPVTTIQEQLQQPIVHPLDELFASEPSAVLHAQQTVTDEPNTLSPAALMEQQVPKIEREERRVMPKEEAEKLTLATTALRRQGSGLFGHLPVVNVETHSDADLLRNQLNSVTIPTDALPVSQDEHRALCN